MNKTRHHHAFVMALVMSDLTSVFIIREAAMLMLLTEMSLVSLSSSKTVQVAIFG
jgi:hypothetical protein